VQIDLPQLAEQLAPHGPVQFNPYMLRGQVEGHEIAVFPDGRVIVNDTTDEAVARTLYEKYIDL
jgi:adenylyltransferase/sulfurtransferase